MPDLSIWQPAKVETPPEATCGFVVQVRLAPVVPVPPVIVSATELESVVTVFPYAS